MSDPQTHINDIALSKLNAIRVLIVLMIALGYASTMALGQDTPEKLSHLGYDPSWIGISLLFFLSGFLGLRSIWRHGSSYKYLQSRVIRNAPLLIVITLIAVLILFPLLGQPHGNLPDTIKTLGLYFIGTVTCIKAGDPLPGLLDNAQYMCLIQGAIWTLKWGLAAHIAVAIAAKLNFLSNRLMILCFSLLAAAVYFWLQIDQTYLNQDLNSQIILAARLAWPFLAGMAAYAYWDKMPSTAGAGFGISALMGVAAILWYNFLPWTPAIEMLLLGGWAMLALSILNLKSEALSFLNKWPAWALAIYLINWPVAQLLLLGMPEIGSWGLVAMTLPTTLLMAWAAHALVTRRSFQFAARKTSPFTA